MVLYLSLIRWQCIYHKEDSGVFTQLETFLMIPDMAHSQIEFETLSFTETMCSATSYQLSDSEFVETKIILLHETSGEVLNRKG